MYVPPDAPFALPHVPNLLPGIPIRVDAGHVQVPNVGILIPDAQSLHVNTGTPFPTYTSDT